VLLHAGVRLLPWDTSRVSYLAVLRHFGRFAY